MKEQVLHEEAESGKVASQLERLPPRPGEWIDRQRPIRFRFEGCEYTGYAGDTITSALAANGVRLLGRSFKYHRPRGVYSLANHDVNVLVSSGDRTNIRCDVTPVWEGADLRAVNTFGSLARDRMRFIDRFGRFLPVGFYYKAFYKPQRLFPFWERQMRAMAGLGAVDARAVRLRTAKAYDWCDVLVIGAGPAGLSAAIAAAEQGAQVVLVDEHRQAGGSLLFQWAGHSRARELADDLAHRARLPNLQIQLATLAAGYYADHWVALVNERQLTKMRAACVVLACGASEQPAVFRNNDLPGVMLGSAAQRLIHLFAVKPFHQAVVLTANAGGYRAAVDMHRAGVRIKAVIDLRPLVPEGDKPSELKEMNVKPLAGHTVYEAIRDGDRGIRGVIVCPLDAAGQPQRDRRERIECDGLAMSVGWAPVDSLFCQAGGKMTYSAGLAQFVPAEAPPGVFVAGRLNGAFELDAQLADGQRAGLEAAEFSKRPLPPTAPAGRQRIAIRQSSNADGSEQTRLQPPPSHAYPIFDHPKGKAFVDLDEDVQLKDIKHSAAEGFDSVELLKRYSTFGMGPTQGKIANTNTIRALARIRGQSVGEIGNPTARPFFHPVALSHLAGRGFHPHRQTPLESRHTAAGARFMPAGDWLRPAYYDAAGQGRDLSIEQEVQAVRQRLGMIDVGTLGKLSIHGPDAAEFLERIYTGRFSKMQIGTTRYALLCDESGVIVDDGVVGRLADDRFYVTTTTTASGSVYREMQRWAIIWGLNAVLANATGSMAAMNLAGPHARRTLAGLCDIDLSNAAFPYLGLREGTVLDVPARLMRTGFVGEVGYEIHVPAQWAARVWDGIMQAGRADGILPFGVEAQRVLRLEKGHIIVSQDTDGLTTPYEAGMGWAIKQDKRFFIGGRSLKILAEKPLQRKLVGFILRHAHQTPMPKECHLVIDRDQIVGRVTSICPSRALDRVLGLAFVHPSQSAHGTQFQIRADGGKLVSATVVKTPFYDPQHARQHMD